MAQIKNKIKPCLWFDNRAEEAANFYISIFKNSKITKTTYYTKATEAVSKMPAGSVMCVDFEIDGQEFMGLNGGPIFKFSEAVSFIINCESQDEIDMFWEKLSEGGEIQMCGWLKDKFGLSWQVVPVELDDMMADKDSEKVERVSAAIMRMKKLDINELKKAYEG